MAGIAITRTELTASELRTAVGKTKDARAGVHRYNAEGLAGRVNRTVPHRPRPADAPARE